MHFVRIKTPQQMDLLALHKVRSRLVRQRTGTINQIRGFLIERGITVQQGPAPLRKALNDVLAIGSAELSPRILRLLEDLAVDWRRLDERIEAVSAEIEALAEQDERKLPTADDRAGHRADHLQRRGRCNRQWGGLQQGRDFGAWLGLVPRQELTGDRTILGKISKRGNKYVRTLFVQAAHVILVKRPQAATRGLMPWIDKALRTWSRSHWPTNWRESPGLCSPAAAPINQPACRMLREEISLWLTKEMDATPLRHPRSTVLVSEHGGSEGMASPDRAAARGKTT